MGVFAGFGLAATSRVMIVVRTNDVLSIPYPLDILDILLERLKSLLCSGKIAGVQCSCQPLEILVSLPKSVL